MAAERRRAKAGGEVLGGRTFKGGQFISAEFISSLNSSGGVRAAVAKVEKKIQKAKFENLRHAVASMRIDAAKSIKRRKDPDKASPPGTPVFTHSGFAKAALRWFVDPAGNFAIMGFTFSKFGKLGETHEKGLTEDGRDYPERPTIEPALERGIVRFQDDWRASIG